MSAIIQSIIQRKAGATSHQTEALGYGDTTGHNEVAGGLRGHSIDHATYPWRVVGHPGGAWSVVGADGQVADRIEFAPGTSKAAAHYANELACSEAHELAKLLKLHHPDGYQI